MSGLEARLAAARRAMHRPFLAEKALLAASAGFCLAVTADLIR